MHSPNDNGDHNDDVSQHSDIDPETMATLQKARRFIQFHRKESIPPNKDGNVEVTDQVNNVNDSSNLPDVVYVPSRNQQEDGSSRSGNRSCDKDDDSTWYGSGSSSIEDNSSNRSRRTQEPMEVHDR
jgi:hypothetical protein